MTARTPSIAAVYGSSGVKGTGVPVKAHTAWTTRPGPHGLDHRVGPAPHHSAYGGHQGHRRARTSHPESPAVDEVPPSKGTLREVAP